jgi:hypothetical protein
LIFLVFQIFVFISTNCLKMKNYELNSSKIGF